MLSQEATNESRAEQGCVYAIMFPRGTPHLLARAEAWREDATYVVRSREFDVLAEGDTFGQALDGFVVWILDRAEQLAQLVEDGNATEDERKMLTTLSARVLPLLRGAEQRSRLPLTRPPRRRGQWRHPETPASSSRRLSAA